MMAMETLTATTLRNIIGDLELDQTLTSRDVINTKMRAILDEATDPWGIKVNRVELKNILPPREIQNAMEKQMKAERERRESILQAEGEKASKILVAEGEKQSAILKADAAKQARIMAAEAEANGSVTAWGVELSAAYMDEMRTSDPNAALRESALPTLLTYSGSEGILSSTTQAETIAAVQSLPDGQVVLDPFAAGNHNYLSDDPATAAALDKALRQTTVSFLTQYLG